MILSHPTARVGSVTTKDSYEPSDFRPTDAILCRNTAPLISFAFSLIRRSLGCHILGREIGTGLIKLVEKQNASNLIELEQKLILSRQRELAKANANGNASAASAIRDKYDCLNIFLREFRGGSLAALTAKIRSLFDDTKTGLLTLATGHKSKGLEWERVFILDRELCPSPYAIQDWQKKQERNVMYVMVTRAKLDLVYIKSHQWKDELDGERDLDEYEQ